jgi:hypothetical protein
MRNVAKTLVALTVLVWGSAASAAVIYDNGISATNGFISDPDFPPTGQFSADDFVLNVGANVITDVHWTGLYAFSNTPQAADSFVIEFYTDVAGAPAVAPFATRAVGNPGRTDTGTDIAGSDLFAYAADIAPLVLAPGTTFWMSIVNDTTVDTDDNWFWGMRDAIGNSFTRTDTISAWTSINNAHEFSLTGPVPEPSSLLLLALGALGLARRRNKRTI